MPVDLQQAAAILKKRQSSDGGGEGGGLRWFKLPDDTTPCIVRFYPPTTGPLPGTVVYRHYGTTPSSICFKTWDMECPSCNKLKLYEDQIDTGDFSSVGKAFFNVQVIDNPKCDPNLPYILGTSEYSYYWLLEQLVNPMVGDITDPNTGHDVIFTRTGYKKAFNRTIGLQARPIAAAPELIQDMLKKAYDFSKIWKKPDDEALQKAIAVAEELEVTIKERLLSLGDTQVVVPAQVFPHVAPVAAPVVPPVAPVVPAPVVPAPVVPAPVVPAPVVPVEPVEPVVAPVVPVEPVEPVEPVVAPVVPVVPVVETPPVAPVVETAPPVAPVVAPVANKPANAPECFAQKAKYDEDSKTCMICPFEFDCSERLVSA